MQTDAPSAAIEAATRAGLDVDRAEVLRAGANVVVRLGPAPVAARLAGLTGRLRDPVENLAREIRTARAVLAGGGPASAPLDGEAAGPHRVGPFVVALWHWVAQAEEDGDPALVGRALAACHRALTPAPDGLEPWAMLREARRLAPLVREPYRSALSAHAADIAGNVAELAGELVAVHGDAHLNNVLWTAGGPVLNDWEDAHLAPREWDLACLVAPSRVDGTDFGTGERALAGYDLPFDERLLALCLRARVFQTAAYAAHLIDDLPGVAPRIDAKLDWLARALP